MNWISKAAGALKGDDSPGQAFNLFCECGQQHQGIRRQKWQRLVCRACGGSLFVLQKDPYPPPKIRAPIGRPTTPAEVEDEVPLENDAIVQKRAARAEVSRPKGLKASPRSTEAAPSKPQPELIAAPATTPPRSSKKSSPLKYIVLLLGLVLVVTVYAMFRSSQKNRATADLRDSIDLIAGAIDRGAWVEARNLLEKAVHAMEILGRSEPEIAGHRQQLREVTAMTSLLSVPIQELLDEADAAHTKGEEELRQFQYKARGQYLFVEGLAERHTDDKSTRVQHRIDLPMSVGQKSMNAQVVLESASLAHLLAKQESRHVIVAAKIESIEPVGKTWEIHTETDSAVLWTSPKTFAGLGFSEPETEEVTDTLKQQAVSLGVSSDAKQPQ